MKDCSTEVRREREKGGGQREESESLKEGKNERQRERKSESEREGGREGVVRMVDYLGIPSVCHAVVIL